MTAMDTLKAETEIAKLQAETLKLQQETIKLQREAGKLHAETHKLDRERFWYPAIVAGGVAAAVAAILQRFWH